MAYRLPESGDIHHAMENGIRKQNLIYFFESSLTPNTFWVRLRDMDLSEGAPVLNYPSPTVRPIMATLQKTLSRRTIQVYGCKGSYLVLANYFLG